jgi:hypothetical protein
LSEEVQRSRGRPSNYKLDRGGVPAEFGPFSGIVMNNADPTRAGRLQVYIETFSGIDKTDRTKWITVSYLPGFFGYTPMGKTSDSDFGTYPGNQNSYGMWFTPPDIGIQVLCVFANGDRNLGYYIGVVPGNGIGHMVPAIGAANNYVSGNKNQETYFADAPLLPVTEINTNNEKIVNSSRFFEQTKPVQGVVAQALFQQGISEDAERGPIRSSSQRESPSAVFGVSTPGVAVYQGGMSPDDIRKKINAGELKPEDAQVISRMGGHTLVMDDGDIDGKNALFRLRTAKGHQIMMNDSGNFFYILHANGQTWLEFGQEGTVDVFSTNSVNIRTQGDINLHADRDINMYAGRNLKMKAMSNINLEADADLTATVKKDITIYSKAKIGIKADGSMALQSASGSWNGGESLLFTAGGIDLNGPTAPSVTAPKLIQKTTMDDVTFSTSAGWKVQKDKLESIVTRAPTHEPYPYHNKGVAVETQFEPGKPTPPPGATPVPAGVEISAK